MVDIRAKLADTPDKSSFVLPPDFRCELREYQKSGVQWIADRFDCELGCMLADDMGLGKTVQAIAHIQPGTLIVAPTSVMSSWEIQLAKFRPNLSVMKYYGSSRTLKGTFDVVLTSYTLLRNDKEDLCGREWNFVILDEAQTIKNPDAQVTRAGACIEKQS